CPPRCWPPCSRSRATSTTAPSTRAPAPSPWPSSCPGTWEEWKVNGTPDRGPTIAPADAADVIFSAAHYLCGLGAGTPDTQRLAVAAYHAGPRAVEEAGGIPRE